jgi:hypothetical protein
MCDNWPRDVRQYRQRGASEIVTTIISSQPLADARGSEIIGASRRVG